MESTLQALLARRRVLSTALPQRSTARSSTTCASEPFDNADDPFALESNGFFTALHSAPSRAEDDNTVDTDAHQRPATSAVNKLNPNPVVVKDGRVLKGTGRKGRRFVANWTPEMDKALRKLLRKFGWGSWSRIAAAGKFPKEYTAKMISNRAKSIGLTRDMFDPGPVPSMSKKKKSNLRRVGRDFLTHVMTDILRKPMLWGIDPLFSVHVLLLAHMLRQMIPGQWGALYFYTFVTNQQPRPIRLVKMAGIVVYISQHQKFTKFLIDDSTGTAGCMVWTNQRDQEVSTEDVKLGAYTELRGRLEWRQGVPVIVVQWLQVLEDPHAELQWWLDVKRVHEQVYRQDYKTIISEKEEASLSQRRRPP